MLSRKVLVHGVTRVPWEPVLDADASYPLNWSARYVLREWRKRASGSSRQALIAGKARRRSVDDIEDSGRANASANVRVVSGGLRARELFAWSKTAGTGVRHDLVR